MSMPRAAGLTLADLPPGLSLAEMAELLGTDELIPVFRLREPEPGELDLATPAGTPQP